MTDRVDHGELAAEVVGALYQLDRVRHVVEHAEVEHDIPLPARAERVDVAHVEVDVVEAVVRSDEARLRDVRVAQVDAVDVLCAAPREVETEEAGVAADVEDGRGAELLAEQV